VSSQALQCVNNIELPADSDMMPPSGEESRAFGVGRRCCSPAPRKVISDVHVDVDRRRGFQQARVGHVEREQVEPMSGYRVVINRTLGERWEGTI
jgi:hypothetical protein